MQVAADAAVPAVPAVTPAAPAPPWWLELGQVVPRAVAGAIRAGRPGADAGHPPLAANPLAWATLAVDELTVATAYLLSRRGTSVEQTTARARAAVAALGAAGFLDDPMRSFPAPTAPGAVRSTRRRRAGLAFEHLSFSSPLPLPADLPGRREWAGLPGSATAHAYLLRRGDRPRPWLVMLHGHRMGEPRDLRLLGSTRLAQLLGVDIAHVVLPLHGPRGRGLLPRFPGVDPVTNYYGMVQAVTDARSLLALLRAEGGQDIGVFGVSLGGHLAALLAALDPQLRCVVAGVPTCDFAEMLATTMRVHWGDEVVAASGVDDEAFRTLSRLVSPLALPVAVAKERRYVYAAVGDRLVTPGQAVALWRHWDQPEILWLQGGHILNNVAASRRFVVDALTACGVRAS